MKASPYFSLMADEGTDVASKKELSVCARWLQDSKPVEHFLAIVQSKETNTEAITGYLVAFLQPKGIGFEKMHGIGFDGTNTMSGHRSGVQTCLRLHAPSAVYVHCRCHKLQLAALNAAAEHTEVNRLLGTLLTIWKAFHYSPKKNPEKLAEIHAELDSSEIKMQEPNDIRWLARERAVRAVRKSLPALVNTFDKIYDETGNAEAHGIATLLTKYNTVACIYMLSDVLHTVAKLQGNLQAKEIDLASVPGMVDSITKQLKELKERVSSSTWFKDHSLVFTDNSKLGAKKIVVTEEEKAGFLQKVYRPYLQSVIDHINGRMESTDFLSSMSVFDPRHLPNSEERLNNYGEEKIRILIDFYGIAQRAYFDEDEAFPQPDIDPEYTEAEWKLFWQLIFRKCRDSSLQTVLSCLTGSDDISPAFLNPAKVATILEVLLVTTATVECSFSSMKLIKTRLHSRMGEKPLDHAMRIYIEGPNRLSNDTLESVVDNYKEVKQ